MKEPFLVPGDTAVSLCDGLRGLRYVYSLDVWSQSQDTPRAWFAVCFHHCWVLTEWQQHWEECLGTAVLSHQHLTQSCRVASQHEACTCSWSILKWAEVLVIFWVRPLLCCSMSVCFSCFWGAGRSPPTPSWQGELLNKHPEAVCCAQGPVLHTRTVLTPRTGKQVRRIWRISWIPDPG